MDHFSTMSSTRLCNWKEKSSTAHQNDRQPTATSNIQGAWRAYSDLLNIPYNSSYSIQEDLKIQPCTRRFWCILQGRPTSHNFHSDQCNSHQLPSSCQMSLHESTLWRTISHLQSQGTLRGCCLCLEQQLDRDWRKEAHPLYVVSLSISKVWTRRQRNTLTECKCNSRNASYKTISNLCSGSPAIPFLAHSERSSWLTEALRREGSW